MSHRRLSILGLVAAGLLGVGALAGCASGAGSAPETSSPDASESVPAADVQAAWLDGGRSIAVVTSGSSTCAPTSVEMPTLEGRVLTVPLAESTRTACTRDFVPRATLVPLPEGVDPTQGLQIAITGAVAGETILAGLPEAPAPVPEFSPSAGWVDSSMVALLTWGSSGCPPVVETVTAAGGEVAIGFATPPADQVCTADMAPRVALAEVGGVAPAGPVQLVLSGGDVVADGPIPVLGVR